MKETLHCYLQILSPVHMGCDEVYDPTSFVLDEEAAQIFAFDPLAFIRILEQEDKEKLAAICKKGSLISILEIYKFLRFKSDVAKSAARRTVPVCSGFVRHYSNTLSLPDNDERRLKSDLNQFVINRTAFLPQDQRPYIPGSAIKGALRTAYLNAVVPTPRGNQPLNDKRKELEKRLLGYKKIEEDPFRLLKVSDFRPVGEAQTRLIYAVNEKKKTSKFDARGPYQLMEVIEPGTVFVGSISVETPEKYASINKPFALGPVMAAAANFYAIEKSREDSELAEIGGAPAQIPQLFQGRAIRIGRHSGAECLTIEGFRKIRIMGKGFQDSKTMDHATTLWLASETPKTSSKKGLSPFGWVGLNHIPHYKMQDWEKKEKAWCLDWENKITQKAALQAEIQAKALAEKEKQEELAIQIAREKEKLEQEEKHRQAAWEAMSPQEKDLLLVMDPATPELQIYEIFERIDDFSPDAQVPLAKALKDCWIRANKWKKKACSNKQWVKVQKICKILGE
ncbi:MAG: type III-A CRISPR-associated RAMP protein Csm5 [Desulfobacterium sp.]|nr:type III-A CRISPR-associated RAMP protein Csm5 [Desulfobacterium sp.]